MRAARDVVVGPHQRQPRRVGERLAVAADGGAAALDVVAQARQAGEAERGARLVEPEVVADVDHVVGGLVAGVAVPRPRRHGVRAQRAHRRGQLLVGGQHGAALAHAQLLLGEEREAAEPADGAGLAPRLGLGADRLRGVLDERDPVGVAQLPQRAEVGGVAAEVHRHHRAGARGDAALDRRRREVRALGRLDVAQHRLGAGVARRVQRRHERQRRHDHLVAGPEPERAAGEVQRRGRARHRHGVGRAGPLRERGLEALRARAHRQPAALEAFGDREPVALGDHHVGERDRPAHASASCSAPTTRSWVLLSRWAKSGIVISVRATRSVCGSDCAPKRRRYSVNSCSAG